MLKLILLLSFFSFSALASDAEKVAFYEQMHLSLCMKSPLSCRDVNLNILEAKFRVAVLCGCEIRAPRDLERCAKVELNPVRDWKGKITKFECKMEDPTASDY